MNEDMVNLVRRKAETSELKRERERESVKQTRLKIKRRKKLIQRNMNRAQRKIQEINGKAAERPK